MNRSTWWILLFMNVAGHSIAYGKKMGNQIFKEKLLHRYTHLGKNNFLKYAYNGAACTYLNSQNEKKDGLALLALRSKLLETSTFQTPGLVYKPLFLEFCFFKYRKKSFGDS